MQSPLSYLLALEHTADRIRVAEQAASLKPARLSGRLDDEPAEIVDGAASWSKELGGSAG